MKLVLAALSAAVAFAQADVTPLWEATMNRDAAAVDSLLKKGGDPNSALPGGETILMTAARTGSAAIVELLLSRGANINATGPQFGETALMVAASQNQPEVIRALLEHGADVNGRS